MTPGLLAVFADAHAHAEALEAVIAAADASGAEALWSLGDMVGAGPDPDVVVTRTRERCSLALMGNHDYGATGSTEPTRFGEPGSPAVRSIELARERLDDAAIAWLRSLRPAARRGDVQCWHGGPQNPVHQYVGASNASACFTVQRSSIGLVGHTHAAAAWLQTPRGQAREGPRRRPARPRRREVAAQPGRRRRARRAAARLVGRARRRRRRGRVLAASQPRAANRDMAPRPVRPGAGTRAGAGARSRSTVSNRSMPSCGSKAATRSASSARSSTGHDEPEAHTTWRLA